MATFGIEAIRDVANARAAGITTAGNLTYTFNRSNGFDSELRTAGHTRRFYFGDRDCWENDIRDTDQGGDDRNWVDNVDIFWIEAHGNRTSDGQARMLYDIDRNNWRTFSGTWQLGENWNAEWIMAYSCKTVDRNNVTGLWNIFAGLHIYCGAWDNMYDGITTDECGEDVADNLTDGDPVSRSLDRRRLRLVGRQPSDHRLRRRCRHLERGRHPLGSQLSQPRPPVGPRHT